MLTIRHGDLEILRMPGIGYVVDGELIAERSADRSEAATDGRPPGRLEYRPCGRVLSVR